MENKTLIGKKNYLFLINDASKELEVHCDNLNLVKNKNLPHIKFDNYMLIVFPNKSLYYKEYLPDNYEIKYRPALESYKLILKDKMMDGFDFLKDIDDCYYKTDTHINLKGNYVIYLEFIKKFNANYGLNLIAKNINLQVMMNIELSSLNLGIGDLTWETNLGKQELTEKKDNYYYSDDVEKFYMSYQIKNNKYVFYDYSLSDKTNELVNKLVDWSIISKYIVYKKNTDKKFKVIIFYDSFLLSILPLYMELFEEVYMVKNVYNNTLIDLIKPDYVLEFRVERFLF